MINLLIVLYLLKIRIFNMTSVDTRIFNQAMDMPFEELEKFLSYISDIKKFITNEPVEDALFTFKSAEFPGFEVNDLR